MSKDKRKQFKNKKNKDKELKYSSISQTVVEKNHSLTAELLSPLDIRKSRQEIQPPSLIYKDLSLRERNLVILEAAINIFNLSESNWKNIKRTISGEQIKELYQIVADLWHPQMDYFSTLPAPNQELRALYLGDIDYELLMQNIFRFGLYTDTIFIVNPFHNPHLFKDEFNPLIHPDKHKADILKILYFLLHIEPWIRAGMVMLVPDPSDFDEDFYIKSFESAKKRLVNVTPSREEIAETTSSSKKDFHRTLLYMPRDMWEETAKKVNRGITREELDNAWNYWQQQKQTDPLALEQSPEEVNNQFTAGRAGLNLETALYLCENIGAFPYTNLKMRWRELLSVRPKLSEEARLWSPLTKGFQELDFKFLDNVDSRFAYEMRDDGRLESFRAYLRRVWNALNEEENYDKIEITAKEFREELFDEYRKAQCEWKQIDTDLIKWMGPTISGALVTGAFSLAPPVLPAMGVAALGVFKLIESYRKRKEFRLKVPMSVFIDLTEHKPRK